MCLYLLITWFLNHVLAIKGFILSLVNAHQEWDLVWISDCQTGPRPHVRRPWPHVQRRGKKNRFPFCFWALKRAGSSARAELGRTSSQSGCTSGHPCFSLCWVTLNKHIFCIQTPFWVILEPKIKPRKYSFRWKWSHPHILSKEIVMPNLVTTVHFLFTEFVQLLRLNLSPIDSSYFMRHGL